MLRYYQPGPNGRFCTIEISEDNAISEQKDVANYFKTYVYENDYEALMDFIAINFCDIMGDDSRYKELKKKYGPKD